MEKESGLEEGQNKKPCGFLKQEDGIQQNLQQL
jgi:hypothetical protein